LKNGGGSGNLEKGEGKENIKDEKFN